MIWREESEEDKRKRLVVKLANYKAIHQETARKKGVLKEFNEATTTTQARKILFG